MAFGHGINANLSIGGTAIEGYLESQSMDLRKELAEMRPLGGTAVQRVAGLEDCTFTADGGWDTTLDALLFNAWRAGTAVATVFSPNGVINYTVNSIVESYNVNATSGDKTGFTVNLSGSGVVSRA